MTSKWAELRVNIKSKSKKGGRGYKSGANPAGILIIMETLQFPIHGLDERVAQLIERKHTLL